MNLARAVEYLDRHINLEATAGKVEGLSLQNMKALIQALGDPQLDVPAIHITGTNGKGSTAHMATRILVEAGLSVGTYGSPHVRAINERVQWNGEPIDDDTLAAAISDLALVEPTLAVTPSWFELMTAAAFRVFADLAVDVAVIEVGKLGRYDATNVIDARVAVVTNIGFDHTDGGPGWREAIAEEKAGIVKPGSQLVLGETSVAVRPFFLSESPARTYDRGLDFGCDENRLAVGGRVVDLRTASATYDDIFVSLHGAHQGDNAAAAVQATEAFLGRPLEEEIVADALGQVFMPGRLEVLSRLPLIVVDGAHNPDGARAAAETMLTDFSVLGDRYVVAGFMRERDPREMLEALGLEDVELLIATTPPSPRALPAEELAAGARDLGIDTEAVAGVADAVDRARSLATEDDSILIVGSLYVAGVVSGQISDSDESFPGEDA